jgi:ABC-type amino acid transport substrate-binding protein
MWKGCRYLALAVLLAALSACTDGKSSRVITVAGDRSFEPYEFCAPYSKYASGILVEIWRLMAKRNNIRVRYGCYDWAVAQAAVSSGHADAIGGMVRSPRREELFHFVRRLVRNPPEYFYFDTNDYASEPDFAAIVNKGTPIGVVDGDYVVEELLATFPGINLRKYKSYFDVVEAADENQIDFFAMEEFVASTHLNRLGIIQRFSRSANPLFHEWLWAAVRKDNIALATELELYFSKVRDDEMTTIERKWTTTSHGALALLLAPVEQWLEENPEVILVASVVVPYYAAILLLYIFWPVGFYRLSRKLRAIDIPTPIAGIDKIPLRYLLLAFLPDTSRHIIDAVIAANHRAIVANFSARRTVMERQTLYMVPIVVSGARVDGGCQRIDAGGAELRERQLSTVLQGVFRRPPACVMILGEGGSGKTSLACWIARRALSSEQSGEGAIFPRPAVPVVLEGPPSDQKLIGAIHGQLNALMDDDIHQDFAVAMLKHGRALVIVDGLSEMSPAGYRKFADLDPAVPRFHTVFTSRRKEAVFGGIAVTEIQTEKLVGPFLVGLFDFCLRELGARDRLSEPEYFSALRDLTALARGTPVTPLLLTMYARLVAAADAAPGRAAGLTGIADLFSGYVSTLNSRVERERRKTDTEVQVALQRCAWVALSGSYKPQSVGRVQAMRAIDADEPRASAMLEYLEKDLGVIDMKSSPGSVRFLLDPLAEYFAAAHLCDESAEGKERWMRFFNFVAERENLDQCTGFAEALLNTVNEVHLAGLPKAFRPQAARRIADLRVALHDMGRVPASGATLAPQHPAGGP